MFFFIKTYLFIMISLFETIKNTMYYKVLSEEFAIIEGNEVM